MLSGEGRYSWACSGFLQDMATPQEEEEVSERAADLFAKRGALTTPGSLEPRVDTMSRPLLRSLPRSSKDCPSVLLRGFLPSLANCSP